MGQFYTDDMKSKFAKGHPAVDNLEKVVQEVEETPRSSVGKPLNNLTYTSRSRFIEKIHLPYILHRIKFVKCNTVIEF